jgi:hypothetical protein
MLLLTSPNDRLQVVTSVAATVHVHTSWVDTNTSSGAVTPGRTNTIITTAATTAVAGGGPAAGVQRNVKTLHVRNIAGAPTCDVTVQHTDGTIVVQLYKCTLAGNDALEYTDQGGFSSAISGGAGGWTTGDAKLTMKNVADVGWVLMNDGTIGDASSGGTTRANADCQSLFTLLWNNVIDTWAPVPGGRGLSAAADWAAHKRITLPRQLGRAIAGAGGGSGLSVRPLGAFVGEETHTQAVTEIAYHAHSVSDPTHAHSVADPSHAHSVYDPSHYHPLVDTPIALDSQAQLGQASPAWNVKAGTATAYAYTGIGIYAAGTGIGIYGAYTGINIVGAGGSAPFNVMQPTAFWNVMLKL